MKRALIWIGDRLLEVAMFAAVVLCVIILALKYQPPVKVEKQMNHSQVERSVLENPDYDRKFQEPWILEDKQCRP